MALALHLDEGDRIVKLLPRQNGLFVVTTKSILRFRSPNELDPENLHTDVPWEQALYLPHGSTDYMVARAILQTEMIARVYFHRSPKYEAMMDVGWGILNSLASLRFIRERLERQVEQIKTEIGANWNLYTEGQNPRPLPTVEYFDIEFRSFVNEVRRALTTISELFMIISGKEIRNGHFHKALTWAIEARGRQSELAQMLTRDLTWISTWIDMRIAIEHPAKDKFIETMNFALQPDRIVRYPTWRFVHPDYDMARPQNLLDVLQNGMQNLLKFSEDLQVVLSDDVAVPAGFDIEFRQIPEAQRDPEMPMRFAIRTRHSLTR